MMRDFIQEYCHIFEGQKIKIPAGFSRIKIDVGLSSNAPQSEMWLRRDPDLLVFGFEPVSRNLAAIRSGTSDWPLKIEPRRINHSLYLFPCALVKNKSYELSQMYVTKVDTGCSSLFKPKSMEIDSTEAVRTFRLAEFFKFFPFDQISIVEHLKVDVQGADYDVLVGAGKYLKKILFITVEIDTANYQRSTNSRLKIYLFLASRGFISTNSSLFQFIRKTFKLDLHLETDDPTFFNIFKSYDCKRLNVYVYQKG